MTLRPGHDLLGVVSGESPEVSKVICDKKRKKKATQRETEHSWTCKLYLHSKILLELFRKIIFLLRHCSNTCLYFRCQVYELYNTKNRLTTSLNVAPAYSHDELGGSKGMMWLQVYSSLTSRNCGAKGSRHTYFVRIGVHRASSSQARCEEVF